MPARKSPPVPTTPIGELWNMSDLTAGWLNELGLFTYEDLCEADLVAVWLDLKARHKQVTRLMYFALWGAVNNCKWDRITDADKALFESELRARA